MFRRSSKGLTKQYREAYESYKVSGVKRPVSFNQFIVKSYNAQLRILQKDFRQIPDILLSKEELKIKRRVLNAVKMSGPKDVSKNVSRAVKRLDVLKNIAKSGRGFADDNLNSDLYEIKSRISMKEKFLQSDRVNDALKNIIKNASADDSKILFDFLNNMKKNAGGHLDAYYKLAMEDFYDKLEQSKKKGQYIKPDEISGERLNIMLSMFKIENSSKYNMDKKDLSVTINKVWNNYYAELTDDEERAIKKIAKRKLGLDLK